MLHHLHRLLLQLFDPRGRASRSDFLAVAIAMLVLQVLWFALYWQVEERIGRISSLPANLLFLYMALSATTRRLHDLGRSGWWLPTAAAGWLLAGVAMLLPLGLLLGPSRVQPGAPAFWLVFAILLVPPLLCALWLHLADGEAGGNRFGPSPEGPRPMPPRRAPKTLHDAGRIAAHA